MDIVQWIVETSAVTGALTPFIMAVVKGSEKFGLSGTAQLAFAAVFGGASGAFAAIALNGVPADVLGWFLLFLQVIMTAGVPIGTYEAIKSAAKPRGDGGAVG